MAAGDVTIHFVSKRAALGKRVIYGEVQLDGSNPTPVNLAAYLTTVKGAVASLRTGAIPTDALMGVTVGISAATLNIYAWQNTTGTDPTPAASTDNSAVVSFIAWGDY